MILADFGYRMFDFGFILMRSADFGIRMFDFGITWFSALSSPPWRGRDGLVLWQGWVRRHAQ